ncbi:nuclease [Sphingobium lactosutens]|uniref:nuclease n=1 Tax=Sphingobium lactosutens TaxID=522773 RepID=UPI0015B915A0|nr:nuclease [Sphingobium lactosutens]NWK96857.1 nuclease [Sphingobium lactosutens]
MARNLYDLDDRQPANAASWLNERQDHHARLLPVGMMLVALAIAAGAAMLFGPALPSAGATASPADTISITESFALCDDLKGEACVLSGNSYVWHGRRYRLADIRVPGEATIRCPEEADRARKARALLAAMMNGGTFEARPDIADIDPSARILTRDGVSLGQLMILKGHARPWSRQPIDWCAA